MAKGNRLALEADRERLLTLLSVAKGKAAAADVLAPIEAAAGYWRPGEKALANFRLVSARLPRLEDPAEADNLRQAAEVIDGGLPPRALMKALGFDTASLDKFNPGQPRVPAGSGPTSGQWTDGAGGGPRDEDTQPRTLTPRLPTFRSPTMARSRPAVSTSFRIPASSTRSIQRI